MNSKIFFKPHVGNNHQNRLVLLSTISCHTQQIVIRIMKGVLMACHISM